MESGITFIHLADTCKHWWACPVLHTADKHGFCPPSEQVMELFSSCCVRVVFQLVLLLRLSTAGARCLAFSRIIKGAQNHAVIAFIYFLYPSSCLVACLFRETCILAQNDLIIMHSSNCKVTETLLTITKSCPGLFIIYLDLKSPGEGAAAIEITTLNVHTSIYLLSWCAIVHQLTTTLMYFCLGLCVAH